jgi:putative transcriptional regulator
MSKSGKKSPDAARKARATERAEAMPAHSHGPPNVNVKAIRRRLNLSQHAFALEFCFSISQIRDWEQGRFRPPACNRAYLIMIDRHSGFVRNALTKLRAETERGREEVLAVATDPETQKR